MTNLLRFLQRTANTGAVVLALTGATHAQQWHPLGPDDADINWPSAGQASNQSLKLDASGNPVVAFRDEAHGGRTTVSRWDGTQWTTIGTAGFSAGATEALSLALDASGNPVVAYEDVANGNRTTVMRWTGSAWVTIGSAGFSTGAATYQSLVLDASDNPLVAYLDVANDYRTTVMRWSGSAWATVGTAGFSTGSARHQNLALDATGNPVVAYQDGAHGDRTTVMRWNGSAWINVGAAGFTAVASGQSLALDASGNPVVAFYDVANEGRVTVMRWNGASWNMVGTAGFSAGTVSYLSLALDNEGNALVAYRDNANGSRTTVMRWSGTAWNTLGVAGISIGTSSFHSLASDSNGNTIVAYSDGGNNHSTTVMQWNGITWSSIGSLQGASSGSAQFPSLAIDAIGNPTVAYRDAAYDNRTTVIRWNGSAWATVGPAGFSAPTAYRSLVMDVSGNPVLAFSDGTMGSRTTVMRWNGSAWNTIGPAGFSAGSANFQSLALDNNSNPVVAYRDAANNGHVSVMRWNGSAWVAVGAAGFSAGPASYLSLALDINDNPLVAYREVTGGHVSVMRWSGSAWVTVGSAGFSAGPAMYPSLVIDASDSPVVAYQDHGNGGRTTVARWNGTTWTTVGAAGLSVGPAMYQSLTIDASGNPVVAYRDEINGRRVTVMRWDGNAWSAVGTPGFMIGPNTDSNSWLKIDAQGNLVVASANGPLFVKRYLNTAVTVGAVSGPLCAGTATEVTYTAVGTFNSGNIFTAQLSDATGSFADPVAIGSVSATGSGSITATIPANTPAGNGYRIRVVASDPEIIGSDNGADITVLVTENNNVPTVSGINGQNQYVTNVCSGTPLTFVVHSNDANPGQQLSLSWNESIPQATFTISSSAHPTGTFSWTPSAQDVGDHVFTATVVDDACPPASNSFGYMIRVLPHTTWYADTDGDGAGDPASSLLACNPPIGYVDNAADCDDTDANSFPGALLPGYAAGAGFDGQVMTLASYPATSGVLAGKMLVGGSFSMHGSTLRNYIARINADGTPDTDFNPGAGANSVVRTAAVQPDGKAIIAGAFTEYDGVACGRIARINPDGSLDPTFNPGSGANQFISQVVIQPDGKVLLVGQFTAFNGTSRVRIARLDPDGSLDATFGVGVGAGGLSVDAITLQADGKILIGGNFFTYGVPRTRIARLNNDGSLDTTFDPGTGANNGVSAIAAQPNGRILIGGQFTAYNGITRNRVARLNSDGSLDTSFDPGSGPVSVNNPAIQALAVLPSGDVLIGGEFTSFSGHPCNYLGRLLPDGKPNTGFVPGTGPNGMVWSLVQHPDGQVTVGGAFTSFNGNQRERVLRVTADCPQFDCTDLQLNHGDACDDGDENTTDDVVDEACTCAGTPVHVLLSARVFLQGPYNSTNGMMHDGVRALGLIPLSEPYTTLSYDHVGGGGEATTTEVLQITGADAIVDWVLLELRDTTDPATVLATRSGLLQRDGDIVDVDGSSPLSFAAPPAHYHVAIRHRNHLAAMTGLSVELGPTAPVIDFTSAVLVTYGTDARKSIDGMMALWAGDANFNGMVSYTGGDNDRDPILQSISGVVPTNSASDYLGTDVNLNGIIQYTGENNDRDIVLQNVGGVVPTNSRSEQLP